MATEQRLSAGQTIILDGRRRYKVINPSTLIMGEPHAILQPVTRRRGEPDVRAVSLKEIEGANSGLQDRPSLKHDQPRVGRQEAPRPGMAAVRSSGRTDKPRRAGHLPPAHGTVEQARQREFRKLLTFGLRYGITGDDVIKAMSSHDNIDDVTARRHDVTFHGVTVKACDNIDGVTGRSHSHDVTNDVVTSDDVMTPSMMSRMTPWLILSLFMVSLFVLAANGVKPLGILIDMMLFGYAAHAVIHALSSSSRHRRGRR